MMLDSGRRLGSYEILELLGVGGMGEVYRARDAKLGRDVAIKVLRQEFSQDEQRLVRFKREAKALASLNHPNIASIYGLEQTDGIHYLVLELVEGETLAERIARGPIPVHEALELASGIARALQEAHEQRIVHRDLKPANVKLTPDDDIKVLDFGLAKVFAEEAPEADSSMSPTLTRDATRVGVILGTAAYMSPEQAKAKRIDKRTDMFAFGAVLFEMLTGKRAFPGDDLSEILASVIKLEPEWSALPADLPPQLGQLLRRCLEKDVKKRRRDIGDVRIELTEPLGDVAAPSERAERGLPWKYAVPLLVLAMLVSGLAVWRRVATENEPDKVRRFAIVEPLAQSSVNERPLALFRDGSKLVYTMRDPEARSVLSLRSLDRFEATTIPGTAGGLQPFMAPDGNWLGFYANGDLKKIALDGGSPVTLVQRVPFSDGASWGEDGAIVFGNLTGLARVSSAGGDVEQLTTVANEEEGARHRWPQILPGAKSVLFTVNRTRESSNVDVVLIESGRRITLIENATDARYSVSGHLLFKRGSGPSIYAAPFDHANLEITGPAVPVLDDVRISGGGVALYDLSDDGTLVYYEPEPRPLLEVVWVDRSGDAAPVVEANRFGWVRLSPDGNRIATAIEDEQDTKNIWIYDLRRQALSRLTFDADSSRPVWSPDGQWVAYSKPGAIERKRADGTGKAELLVEQTVAFFVTQAFSPDGTVLAFTRFVSGAGDLGFIEIGGNPNEPTLFLDPDSEQRSPAFSPNGTLVAYVSDESGRDEVYVRDFPSPGGKWQISLSGGEEPVWSKDGRELFFRQGYKMMAVPIGSGPSTRGQPRLLFETAYELPFNRMGPMYDVASDGRFLMLRRVGERPPAEIRVVLNFDEELERLAPTH